MSSNLPLPELVILLEEPLVFDVDFLQGAAASAFGVNLPTDEPEAEEFVTGEFPIFFVQYKRRLLQVKSMFLPYFDPEVREFVSGDPQALLAGVKDAQFRRTIDRHKGWISVALMNSEVEKKGSDPLKFPSKMLSAFGFEEIAALIQPSLGRILPWEWELQEMLSHGKGSKLFE